MLPPPFNKIIRLIDTAGLRKKTKITEKIELLTSIFFTASLTNVSFTAKDS